LLSEKDLLIAEIHHRVKNNLQLIVSLLESQTAFLKEGDALKALQISQNRIQAISMVHQKLYLTDNITTINLGTYLTELTAYLSDSFSISGQIQFQLDFQEVEVSISKAVSIGLILNEIVINAIKHAYPGNKQGSVFVSLSNENERFVHLKIKDDGKGLPEGLDINSRNSLGFRLIRGLCHELQATLEVHNNPGVQFDIVFGKYDIPYFSKNT
jgi:two-component sensor histidine kinase